VVLSATEAQKILDACGRLRDRLLFALLLDTGMRVGEALGLRHEDLCVAERHVIVMPRRNDNHARAKSGRCRTIPASAEVMRLYVDYLNGEYGALDSDYTYATWLLRRGAGMEAVKELLGHASVTTTIDTYGHLTVEDARRTLEQAGWFTGREVRL
jgi:site-specific recombinase XerD